MKAFQVRNKNAKGKAISGWRTIHANSESEAVLKDFAIRDRQRQIKNMLSNKPLKSIRRVR